MMIPVRIVNPLGAGLQRIPAWKNKEKTTPNGIMTRIREPRLFRPLVQYRE